MSVNDSRLCQETLTERKAQCNTISFILDVDSSFFAKSEKYSHDNKTNNKYPTDASFSCNTLMIIFSASFGDLKSPLIYNYKSIWCFLESVN